MNFAIWVYGEHSGPGKRSVCFTGYRYYFCPYGQKFIFDGFKFRQIIRGPWTGYMESHVLNLFDRMSQLNRFFQNLL